MLLPWPKQGHVDQPSDHWLFEQQQVGRSTALCQSLDVFSWEYLRCTVWLWPSPSLSTAVSKEWATNTPCLGNQQFPQAQGVPDAQEMVEQENGWVTNPYVTSGAAPAFCLWSEIPMDKLGMTGYLSELQPISRLKESNFLEHWTRLETLHYCDKRNSLDSWKILTGTLKVCNTDTVI